MSLLLEQQHEGPRSRYALFEEYYQTIFKRELGKKTPEARLLAANASHIHALHAWAGLALQARSEQKGEAAAALSLDELTALVVKRLRSEEMPEAEAFELARSLIRVTENRLILLHRFEDRFGFEVRSLQEFMAARALVSGDGRGDDVLERLAPLVPSAHWRHTWLLAAGCLFTREALRAELLVLLADADNADQLAQRVRPGARLALDLLEDGVAGSNRRYQQALAKHALDLLAASREVRSAAGEDSGPVGDARELRREQGDCRGYPRAFTGAGWRARARLLGRRVGCARDSGEEPVDNPDDRSVPDPDRPSSQFGCYLSSSPHPQDSAPAVIRIPNHEPCR